MTAHRSVRVGAVIERPPPLPWVGDLPVPQPVESWPGTLLSWRWLDKDAGLWVGIARYQRDGLLYEQAVSGELLTVLPGSAVVAERGHTLSADVGQPQRTVLQGGNELRWR